MLLSKLAKKTESKLIGGDVDINRIEYDSRRVVPGNLFVCVNGTFLDGHKFAESAVKNGAAALLVERELSFDVPQVIVPNTRIAMAEMAAELYEQPAKGITIIGVTGTNGKTTTTYMLKSIFERAGHRVGLIGTIRNLVGNAVIPTTHTTPESVELMRIFRIMRDAGVDVIVMEVSSQALDQNRAHGIEYTVGGFTNLTQDHLDYHKTMENYLRAKRKMFENSKFAVVNADDKSSAPLIDGLGIGSMTYGINNDSDIHASNIEAHPKGIEYDLSHDGMVDHVVVNIPGLFNVYNSMLAAAIALKLGVDMKDILGGLSSVRGVSGRMEALNTEGFDFSVFLDFAHTPDGLFNILAAVHEFARGRVIAVFGCGGDKDKTKRPIMGRIAGSGADYCIVTSDNPRTENPMEIIDMVLEGVNQTDCPYEVIENRRDAIDRALHIAKKGDVIVLAGKGHETYQEINGIKHPFDEKLIVSELLAEMRKEG